MHFVVSGHQLNADAVARAVALSHEKYCSATAMLAKTAQVTTSHELVAV
jgi:putative redox protein